MTAQERDEMIYCVGPERRHRIALAKEPESVIFVKIFSVFNTTMDVLESQRNLPVLFFFGVR